MDIENLNARITKHHNILLKERATVGQPGCKLPLPGDSENRHLWSLTETFLHQDLEEMKTGTSLPFLNYLIAFI